MLELVVLDFELRSVDGCALLVYKGTFCSLFPVMSDIYISLPFVSATVLSLQML